MSVILSEYSPVNNLLDCSRLDLNEALIEAEYLSMLAILERCWLIDRSNIGPHPIISLTIWEPHSVIWTSKYCHLFHTKSQHNIRVKVNKTRERVLTLTCMKDEIHPLAINPMLLTWSIFVTILIIFLYIYYRLAHLISTFLSYKT